MQLTGSRIKKSLRNALAGLLLTAGFVFSATGAIVNTENVFIDSTQGNWVIDRWSGSDSIAVQAGFRHGGTHAIGASLAPWGALTLDRRTASWSTLYPIQPAEFTHLSFWVSTGPDYDSRWESLAVLLNNQSDRKDLKDYVSISQGGAWYFVRIPIADLNNTGTEFYQFVFFNYSAQSGITLFIDDIVLEQDDSIGPTPDPDIGNLVLASVDASQTSPISPYIYGVNSFAENTRFARHSGLHRAGGNRWSAYNWENNASNAGSDYFHHSDNYILWSMGLDDQGSIPGRAVQAHIEIAAADDAAILVTIPMLDYVSADKDGTVPESQIPVRPGLTTYPRWHVNLPTKGSPLTYPPNLNDKYVYQEELVHWIETTAFPIATRTRPIFYSLDNEPALWADTHARNHPEKATYSEIAAKSIAYASMIKNHAPDSLIFGPVTYGWMSMVNLQEAPDAAGRDFINFYLSSLQQAHTSAGRRLVDVLDIHWYPEAKGDGTRITQLTSRGLNPAQIEGIVQAPRSYWDESYREDSWIAQYVQGGYNGRDTIALIPRLKDQIASHCPGTRIAITEYVSGGDLHIAGGIAQADSLGIFGREGVFAAAYWSLIDPEDYPDSYTFGAFASYINYDGSGSKVGDLSVQALTSDHVKTSVYAMRSSIRNDRMWIIAINKTNQQIPLRTTLSGSPAAFNLWKVYRLQTGDPDPQHVADYAFSGTNIGYLMPAYSVTTIELSTEGGGAPPPPLPGENEAPALVDIGNKTIHAGQTLQFTIDASDANPEDQLSFSASGSN